jgi:beta-glucosidase
MDAIFTPFSRHFHAILSLISAILVAGEDPYLGYRLVQPAITGIQSQGVIANAKHYINNNHETNRMNVSEIVDRRTRWEVYYGP